MSFANKAGGQRHRETSQHHQAVREAGHLKIVLRAGSLLLSVVFLVFVYGGLANIQTGNNAVIEAIMGQTKEAMEQSRAAMGTSTERCMALVEEHGRYDADEHLSLKAAMAEDRRQGIRVNRDDRDALKILQNLQRCSWRTR
ncbi:MAG: hypothetical protein AAFO61_06870 [Pseudomonadota bacterium]